MEIATYNKLSISYIPPQGFLQTFHYHVSSGFVFNILHKVLVIVNTAHLENRNQRINLVWPYIMSYPYDTILLCYV